MTTSSGDVPDDGLKDIQEDMAIDDACDLAGKPSAISKQRPGFYEIGGANTVEQLDKTLLLLPSRPFVQLH